MKQRIIVEIIALLLVVLFLYTGISKLTDYMVFKEQIGTSPILRPFASWLAWLLPLAEIGVAVTLLMPQWRLHGLYISLVLMIVFTGYIIAILNFSAELPCSCGGILESLSWQAHLVFNSAFIVLAAIGIVLQRKLDHFKATV